MRLALSAAALMLLTGVVPATAQGYQDYYETMASIRHGHGYIPAFIVAGEEDDDQFAVVGFVRDGNRKAVAGTVEDWKAIVVVGPRKPSDDDDDDDDRYLDRKSTTPKRRAPAHAPIARTETSYSSVTCPALAARIEALRPLATFEFNPPTLDGNMDGGAKGNSREGLDLWMHVGGAELTRSSETSKSKLGAWFKDTRTALAACPGTKAP